MKRSAFLFIFLSIFTLSTCAQIGYLGKRAHLQFETRFSPAWNNLDFNARKGIFRFNYNIMPSIEFVVSKSWSVNLNYQYYKTCFSVPELPGNYRSMENIYRGISPGDLHVHGFGAHAQYYFSHNAPMGYYLKLGFDTYFHKASTHYRGYDSLIVIHLRYYDTYDYEYFDKPGNYSANNWTVGFRIELGKNLFLGKYFSIGTSISFGILLKGWSDALSNRSSTISDYADKQLITNYIGGISIKVGFMPF